MYHKGPYKWETDLTTGEGKMLPTLKLEGGSENQGYSCRGWRSEERTFP